MNCQFYIRFDFESTNQNQIKPIKIKIKIVIKIRIFLNNNFNQTFLNNNFNFQSILRTFKILFSIDDNEGVTQEKFLEKARKINITYII